MDSKPEIIINKNGTTAQAGMLVRQCDWNVEPGGDTAKDKEAAEFVQSCMNDMQDTWIDTISEILSFLTYGWSFHEIVYKRRMGNTKGIHGQRVNSTTV